MNVSCSTGIDLYYLMTVDEIRFVNSKKTIGRHLLMKSLPLRVKLESEELTLELEAVESALTGNRPGRSTRFAGASEKLKGVEEFEGELGALRFEQGELEGPSFEYRPK